MNGICYSKTQQAKHVNVWVGMQHKNVHMYIFMLFFYWNDFKGILEPSVGL